MAVYPLISMNDLKNQLGDTSLRIVDCRFSLQDVNWGANSFAEAHIPGAIYADLNRDLSSQVGPKTGRHPLPSEKSFLSFLQDAGISEETRVVAYDDASGSMTAARFWWLLKVYGLQNVQVLDGSFSIWKEAGFPVTSEKTIVQKSSFLGKIDSTKIVDAVIVDKARRDQSRVLIDARSHDRFMGQNEIIDKVAGHIPGAINRPILDNLGEDKLFKNSERLKLDFQSLIGENKTEDVILYCGSGVTACFNFLAMEAAGMNGAKIYPGSWSEWITDPAHEIATGE